MRQKAICFFGRSGSGKGEQARALAAVLHWPIISTGDLIRAEAREDTPLGRKCAAVLEGGVFLSPEDVVALDRRALANHRDATGLIFEGSPRSGEEAKFLNGHLESQFIWLSTPPETCRTRLFARGRHDDTPHQIARRFASFDRVFPEVRSAVCLIEVDGNRPPNQVTAEIWYIFKYFFCPLEKGEEVAM